MSLQRLRVEDVRCIAEAELDFDPRCNLVSGPNASGKTTLLEAIYVLGRGRSFRLGRLEPLIREGQKRLRVVGRVRHPHRTSNLGFEADRDSSRARIDGRPALSLAELAVTLPVQAIDPEVHRLIDGGPSERRRFVDWGVFHVEPTFVDQWRRFQRALRQRNAALAADGAEAVVRAWDPELIEAGSALLDHRTRYVAALSAAVAQTGQRLLDASVTMELRPGWAADLTLAQALDASWPRDRAHRQTHAGPHRAELVIRLNGSLARGRVSRGQQKLLASALLLGQLRHDSKQGSRVAALLVDDPAAELDASRLACLIREIRDLPVQLFVTALNPDHDAIRALDPGRRFHVEHGKMTALV